jgi:hypothetical protein
MEITKTEIRKIVREEIDKRFKSKKNDKLLQLLHLQPSHEERQD